MSIPVEAPDFGPDFTTTVKDDPPKSQKAAPRTTDSTRRNRWSLGDNKKVRSGVRRLTDEDKPKLAAWYEGIAFAAAFIRPQLAKAIRIPAVPQLGIPSQIDRCVDAWFDLAEDNDKVRRVICGMIEGGGWGKVMLAHLPFFLAVLPEQFVEQFLMVKLGDVLGDMQAAAGDGMNMMDGLSAMFGAAGPMGGPMYPADMQTDPNE